MLKKKKVIDIQEVLDIVNLMLRGDATKQVDKDFQVKEYLNIENKDVQEGDIEKVKKAFVEYQGQAIYEMPNAILGI